MCTYAQRARRDGAAAHPGLGRISWHMQTMAEMSQSKCDALEHSGTLY